MRDTNEFGDEMYTRTELEQQIDAKSRRIAELEAQVAGQAT